MKFRHLLKHLYYIVPLLGLVLTFTGAFFIYKLEYQKANEMLKEFSEERFEEIEEKIEAGRKKTAAFTFEDVFNEKVPNQQEPILIYMFDKLNNERRIYTFNDTFQKLNQLPKDFTLAKSIMLKGQEYVIVAMLNKNSIIGIDWKKIISSIILGILITLFASLYVITLINKKKIERDLSSYKKAEEDYLGMVVHELRTPLSSLIMALALMKDQKPTATKEKESLLKIAYRNSKRLVRMVNTFLGTKRVPFEKQEYHLHPYGIVRLIEDAIEDARTYEKEYGVTFKFKKDIKDAHVLIDRDAIREVLDNLFSNAAKYTVKNDIIEIKAERIKGWIRISVSDQGPGIPDTFHEKIFKKYARNEFNNSNRKGNGYGLAISRSIIQKHRGHLGFSTILNQGTTFYFELKEI